MLTRHFRPLAVCAGALVLASLPLVRSGAIQAEGPRSVVRTFGFWMDAGGAVPDFTGENSVAVVALPNTAGNVGTVNFCNCESNGILSGTQWKRGAASHITRGANDDQGAFMWLATEEQPDAPPPGAVALTGSGGSIIGEVKVYGIKLCGGDCSPSTSYYVPDHGATDVFVVVEAVFSK